ncbi:MAG: hypothetical protein HOK06_08495, partial [Rhodospirillaceae bacterium]|nr:hypothetical protein [Rhodospirillaceae bacterium]
FFILLVSISTLEDVKSKAAMESLTSTFTTILPPSLHLTSDSSSDGKILAGQQFQEQITNIFSTTIQVSKVEVVQPGRLMRVQLNADVMFEEDKAEIRETYQPLLDRIVASLSGRPAGLRFDMEFIIGSAYTSNRSLPIGQTLEMSRAGAFVREMMSRGVPPDSVSVGIKAGAPDEINILFYVRSSDEAQLDFSQPDAVKEQ